MNKQELISIIRTEILLAKSSPERKGYIAGLEEAISIIEGFSDEPQKPVVPQYIAEWIDYCKMRKISLAHALYRSDESVDKRVFRWVVDKLDNQETFAKAWLFGYEVEKEKRYTVKLKTYLGQFLGRYYLNDEELTPQFTRSQLTGKGELPTFTRQELEETGFGWVFDCEGVEAQEVEE